MDAFVDQVVRLRGALLRSARARLRNPDWAEDAVSETILAALERRPDMADPAQITAWLFGILRHKAVDQVRRHLGQAAGPGGPMAGEPLVLLADERTDPVHCAIGRQFVTALGRQLERLPPLQARAFVLRDGWGGDTDDICALLQLNANHLAVVLHRARGRLRDALAEHRA